MFYRVENGDLIQTPEKNPKIFMDNPTDEQYRFLGYNYNIVDTSLPDIDNNDEGR